MTLSRTMPSVGTLSGASQPLTYSGNVKLANEGAVHHRTCPLCEAMCGLRVEVEGDRVLSIKGDRNDPFSCGHICPKAAALGDFHTDPDRLRSPIRKEGSDWKKIGWSEALDLAAGMIHEIQHDHGQNSFATYLGNPTVHNFGAMLFVPIFLRHLGSRSIFSATSVDQLPHMVVAQQVFGHKMLVPVPDVDRSDYLLLLGANPIASNGSMMTVPDVRRRFQALQGRGGKIVVIDPRRTETAALADQHFFIRPGTDALFLLALLRELLIAGPRLRHLEGICDGLEELGDLCATVTPEVAAKHTGLEADAIRRLASEFRNAPSAACYGRMGTSTQAFGGLCQWLITVINAVSGNLDREGGVMFTEPAFDIIRGPRFLAAGRGRLKPGATRVRGLPAFGGELPAAALAEEILEPGTDQIHGLICFAANPVLSTPNGKQLDRALASLKFIVSVDPYLNETSRHAHVILPPPSPLERSHYDIAFHALAVRNTAKYSAPLFTAPTEAMHDWQILLGLHRRLARSRGKHRLKNELIYRIMNLLQPEGLLSLGLRFGPRGAGFNPFSSKLSLRVLRQSPHGVDLGPLRPCLKRRLFPSRPRVNLAPTGITRDIERLQQSFAERPAGRDEESLLLIGRRNLRDNNSWMHNFERLMGGKPRCTLLMHPNDAKSRGLAEHDRATVSSRVGTVTVEVAVTEDISQGVVSLPHGYGHDRPGTRLSTAERHAGVSLNDLTDDLATDELTGTAAFSGIPVAVRPIE